MQWPLGYAAPRSAAPGSHLPLEAPTCQLQPPWTGELWVWCVYARPRSLTGTRNIQTWGRAAGGTQHHFRSSCWSDNNGPLSEPSGCCRRRGKHCHLKPGYLGPTCPKCGWCSSGKPQYTFHCWRCWWAQHHPSVCQGTPRQSKSSPRGTPTTKGKGNTSTSNLCLESNTKSQPAQSRGGPITGPDNSAPTVRGCSVPAARKGIHGSTKTRKPGVRVPPHKRGIRHRATWMFGQEIRALGADLPKARTVHLSERTTLGPPSQPLVCPRHRSAHTEGARLATRPLL